MVITQTETRPARVLVIEPNVQLRAAILAVLGAAQYTVEACDSLGQVLQHSDGAAETIALVAWQSMEGLLAEEHRHTLSDLTRRVRLVLMVPRHWARLLEGSDLGGVVAGLIAKPFEADELLTVLMRAEAAPLGQPAS